MHLFTHNVGAPQFSRRGWGKLLHGTGAFEPSVSASRRCDSALARNEWPTGPVPTLSTYHFSLMMCRPRCFFSFMSSSNNACKAWHGASSQAAKGGPVSHCELMESSHRCRAGATFGNRLSKLLLPVIVGGDFNGAIWDTLPLHWRVCHSVPQCSMLMDNMYCVLQTPVKPHPTSGGGKRVDAFIVLCFISDVFTATS